MVGCPECVVYGVGSQRRTSAWDELSERSHQDPIVRACLMLHANGQMTLEKALIALALELSKQNAELRARCVELVMKQPPPEKT